MQGMRRVCRRSWLPVDRDVLEGALGQAFAALDVSDWEAPKKLFCLLGFRVVLWSAGVSLQAAH